MFETKFGQDSKNQFDGGQKGGEQLKVLIRGYFVGKLPIMKHLLAWAERHGTVPISESEVEALRCHLDECPVVISHLLWAFLKVNFTAAARYILQC